MKRAPSPAASGLPPTSKARCDDSDDEKGPSELDINFLKEQNLQLATSLYGFRQKIKQNSTELSQLRTKSVSDTAISSTLLRQLQVLHADLFDMAKSIQTIKTQDNDSSAHVTKYDELKSQLMENSDKYLLSAIRPVEVEKEILLAEWPKIANNEMKEELSNDDEETESEIEILEQCGIPANETEKEKEKRIKWLSDEVNVLCSLSHEIVASLIPALSAAIQQGSGEVEKAEEASCLMVSNRSLRAEVAILKEALLKLERQTRMDKAVTLMAQRSCHQAERVLHLHLAGRTLDPSLPIPAAGEASVTSLADVPTTPAPSSQSRILEETPLSNQPTPMSTPSILRQVSSANGTILEEEGGNKMECDHDLSHSVEDERRTEELESLKETAALRLTQLERVRNELKQEQDNHSALLDKIAVMDEEKARSSNEGQGRMKFLENELERERRDGKAIQESSLRMGDELKAVIDRMKASEHRFELFCQGTEKEYNNNIISLNSQLVKLHEELELEKRKTNQLVDLEQNHAYLQKQVNGFNALLEQSQSRAKSLQQHLDSCKKIQEKKSLEVEEARKLNIEFVNKFQLEEGEEEDVVFENNEEIGKECSLKVHKAKIESLSSELETMKEVNDAMLEEMEQNAKVVDELTQNNMRMMQQSGDQEEVNRLLMTKNRLLRDAKDADMLERDNLVMRLSASEETRTQLEEHAKAKEMFVRAAENQRIQHSSQLLMKERDFIHLTEKNNQLESELEEMKMNYNLKKVLSQCEETRVQVLTTEMKALRKERDSLEESFESLSRKYEKAERKWSKEKQRLLSNQEDGGGGKIEEDTDIEYRELLEFENEELKKQVNCPINKEKIKNVMLIKCGHAFSRDALDKRVSDRMRRCPACNKGFGVDDMKPIYLTS